MGRLAVTGFGAVLVRFWVRVLFRTLYFVGWAGGKGEGSRADNAGLQSRTSYFVLVVCD